jgi:hypothetical protein
VSENVEKERTLVKTDHCLGIRMIVNMDKELVRQILTPNLNTKKCVLIPKNLPVFSWKTNTYAQTCSIFTRSFFQLKCLLKGTHFQSSEDIHKKKCRVAYSTFTKLLHEILGGLAGSYGAVCSF